MARYIDADKFKDHLKVAQEKMHVIGGVKAVDVGAVIKALDMQPTANVVEAVRCKDCKYHRDLDGGVKCERMDGLLMTLPNDFCSYGIKGGADQ